MTPDMQMDIVTVHPKYPNHAAVGKLEVTEFTPDGRVRCRTLEGKCRTIGAWKPEDLVVCERGGAA